MRRVLAWLGLVPPVEMSGVCRCGHPLAQHEHYRTGRDCSACVCGRFRDDPDAVDLAAACRDEQVIDAVLADDIDHALLLAPADFVGLLVALRDVHGVTS